MKRSYRSYEFTNWTKIYEQKVGRLKLIGWTAIKFGRCKVFAMEIVKRDLPLLNPPKIKLILTDWLHFVNMLLENKYWKNLPIDNYYCEIFHSDQNTIIKFQDSSNPADQKYFEISKSRALAYPEVVPFRLTHMIDAMGDTGYEGTFRKTCDATIRVMREQSDGLIT
ncbi:hypothetical protein B4U79_12847 [Dinothrombium tinctorium]|uniref:PI3K/PI4K catalytic domain-containing protein n=1 Tax=Dinothrombium tinctorium TaxID=1965070 RepID=A0A443QEE9_9ACAR|nr:hypothetical protein B4U79_12847 [Dinothrombium tinctorium]